MGNYVLHHSKGCKNLLKKIWFSDQVSSGIIRAPHFGVKKEDELIFFRLGGRGSNSSSFKEGGGSSGFLDATRQTLFTLWLIHVLQKLE